MIPSPQQARQRSPDPRRLEPAELTPVYQRTSRRLSGEQPEFGPLFDSLRPAETVSSADTTIAAQATPSPSHIIVDSPRTPEARHFLRFQMPPNKWHAKRPMQRRCARVNTPRRKKKTGGSWYERLATGGEMKRSTKLS
ncbi:hypothetical protein HPB52_022966 [Rhipicephalus sanguineus]|uniref:Uncharacterized protein n=1 Tax=Rhipicephalus sanguineus TaxID=34632 RepID=A0A9D4PKD0_RHISA|nr:hypothetical protein HPB52_022966 [Rhipicephalus sanguineus]